MSTRAKQLRTPYRRTGVVLICVIACLAITMSLVGSAVRSTLMVRKQLRVEHHRRQAVWLVQAGVERAAFRIQQDENYAGEEWDLSASAMNTRHPALVAISAQPVDRRFEVKVTAEYPAGNLQSVRHSQTFYVDTNSE